MEEVGTTIEALEITHGIKKRGKYYKRNSARYKYRNNSPYTNRSD